MTDKEFKINKAYKIILESKDITGDHIVANINEAINMETDETKLFNN